MRKMLVILLTVSVALMLYGCGNKGGEDPKTEKPVNYLEIAEGDGAVTFVNGAREAADVWLIPDTEANRKTSLWGKAMIPDLESDGSARISLTKMGGPGVYLLRMIDTDEMYYEANGVRIEDGYTLRLKDGEHFGAMVLEVTDASGTVVSEYEVFWAAL